jgi:hypothetical protein
MKRYVLTHNEVEGFHYYPCAPEECNFLSSIHRHVFVIDCAFEVAHNEREIEIITQQQEIERALNSQFGKPSYLIGAFKDDAQLRNEFFNLIK